MSEPVVPEAPTVPEQSARLLALQERLARAMALADAMGPNDPDFDMKAFTDAMWDDQ
jgi:antitoxin VapB